MSDAAVDIFRDAFEEDQIRLAVAAAMAKLAKDVRGLPTWDMGEPGGQNVGALACNWHAVLALIEKATP